MDGLGHEAVTGRCRAGPVSALGLAASAGAAVCAATLIAVSWSQSGFGPTAATTDAIAYEQNATGRPRGSSARARAPMRVELALTVHGSGPVRLAATDAMRGLPAQPTPPARPPAFMEMPSYELRDPTLVTRSFEF